MFSVDTYAQMFPSEKAPEIKKMKLIIALTEYPPKATEYEKAYIDSLNASLTFAVKNYWTYSEIEGAKPLEEAKVFVKQHDKTHCYIAIVTQVSHSLHHSSGAGSRTRTLSEGDKIVFFAPDEDCWMFMPVTYDYVSNAAIVFPLQMLQNHLYLQESGVLKPGFMNSLRHLNKNGHKMQNKTLLIPEFYFDSKMSKEDISSIYKYKIELCDQQKLEKVILEKDPKYAVMFYTEVPVGGDYAKMLPIISSEDGDFYGSGRSDNIFRLDLGIVRTTGSIGNYLIDKKVLKSIFEIANKK